MWAECRTVECSTWWYLYIYTVVHQDIHTASRIQAAVSTISVSPLRYIAPLQPVLFNQTHTIHLSPTIAVPPTADMSALFTSTALHNSWPYRNVCCFHLQACPETQRNKWKQHRVIALIANVKQIHNVKFNTLRHKVRLKFKNQVLLHDKHNAIALTN